MTRLPRFEVPSYGMRGRPLRYPKSRTGESQYDREMRLRQEMQMQLRGEYLAGRGELGRQREEQKRVKEKMEAEGWELKYSAKQRADMAQSETAFQGAMKNPIFSEDEKVILARKHAQTQLGFTKTAVPPDPNKPKAPGEHEFGEPFMDDDGATYAYEVNAQGRVELKLKQRYDQSPEHHKMEAQREWEKERGELQLELMREEITVPGTDEGDLETTKRKYENWQIQEMLEFAGYGLRSAPIPPQGAPPQPQMPMGPPPGAQPAPARPLAVRPPGREPLVSTAKVKEYVERTKKKYPNVKDIPINELRKLKRAYEILKGRQ